MEGFDDMIDVNSDAFKAARETLLNGLGGLDNYVDKGPEIVVIDGSWIGFDDYLAAALTAYEAAKPSEWQDLKVTRSEQHEHQRRKLWLRHFEEGIAGGFTTESSLGVADHFLSNFDARFDLLWLDASLVGTDELQVQEIVDAEEDDFLHGSKTNPRKGLL
jgi:hypothetical protein